MIDADNHDDAESRIDAGAVEPGRTLSGGRVSPRCSVSG
jgi:hypothetical protein